jgi:hypothetical protein
LRCRDDRVCRDDFRAPFRREIRLPHSCAEPAISWPAPQPVTVEFPGKLPYFTLIHTQNRQILRRNFAVGSLLTNPIFCQTIVEKRHDFERFYFFLLFLTELGWMTKSLIATPRKLLLNANNLIGTNSY